MNYKSIFRMTLLALGMIFLFNLAASAQTANCEEQSDKDLVLTVYEKLKPAYDNQLGHINIRAYAYDGVVILEGWVLKESDVKKIQRLVAKMDCVHSVVAVRLRVGKGVGCGPGQQDCNGTCISNKVECNVCLTPGRCKQ